MKRRTCVGAAAAALLVAALNLSAQQPGRPALIGLLDASSPDPTRLRNLEAFQQGLRDLGYVEGRNVSFVLRWGLGDNRALPGLAHELIDLKVDVIVTASTPAAVAAKEATSTIPIVLAQAGDPVGTGLVSNLRRPGGNVTGMSLLGPEVNGKRLELLKDIVPDVTRVAVIYNPNNPAALEHLKRTQEAASSLGVFIQPLEITPQSDVQLIFAKADEIRSGALVVFLDPLTAPIRGQLATLATKYRLPAIYETKDFADAGGLLAYGPSLSDVWRRAAPYVDKILKGAKPGDLPIEQPTKFELVINLKTAKALGIAIPQKILLRADELIQ
jgi:putative ABC transport system substrate-binding protein